MATATVGAQETPAPTIDPLGPQGDLRETIGNAVLACLEKNVSLLRSFVAGDTTDAEIEAMFARGSGVRLLAQDADPAIEDGMVTVEVSLDAGADEPVEREWELERGDDSLWRFTSVPD